MVKARRFAPGRGDRRAANKEGGSAMVSVRVNDNGESSFVVKDSKGVGSCAVVLRVSAESGNSVGSRGGILSSELSSSMSDE